MAVGERLDGLNIDFDINGVKVLHASGSGANITCAACCEGYSQKHF